MNINKSRSTANQISSSSQPKQYKVSKKDNDFRIQLRSKETEQLRNYKFCSVCGWQLLSCKQKLNSHFKAQHQNLLVEPSWLKNAETPTDCIFTNWNDFKDNPSRIQLQMRKDHVKNTGGRKFNVLALFAPKKKIQKIDAKSNNVLIQKIKKKSFLELYLKQQQFQKDPKKYKEIYGYRRRHLVLKEYHLAAIRKERKKQANSQNIVIPQNKEKQNDLEVLKIQYENKIQSLKQVHQNQIIKLQRKSQFYQKVHADALKLYYSQQAKNKQLNLTNRNFGEIIKAIQIKNDELNQQNCQNQEKIELYEQWKRALRQDEKEYLEDFEKLKLKCLNEAKELYIQQINDSIDKLKDLKQQNILLKKELNSYKEHEKELALKLKDSEVQIQNQIFTVNKLRKEFEEERKSKEGYQKQIYKYQNQTEKFGEELEAVMKNMEWILFHKDSEGDLKIQRIEEFKKKFKNDQYLRNISKKIITQRNKYKNEIKNLENDLNSLKNQNLAIKNENLNEYKYKLLYHIQQILEFIKEKIQEEEYYVNKDQQNTQLIKFLKSIIQKFIALPPETEISTVVQNDLNV